MVVGLVAGFPDNHCIPMTSIDDATAKADVSTGVETVAMTTAASLPIDSDCARLTTDENEKRDWMGIEPIFPNPWKESASRSCVR